MKKSIAFLLSLSLVLALAACGQPDTLDASDKSDNPPSQTQDEPSNDPKPELDLNPQPEPESTVSDPADFMITDGMLSMYTGLNEGSIVIPDGVTKISPKAFALCDGLTGMTIPDGAVSIGNEAFYGCAGLTSATIPDSVTSIGIGAFEGCNALTDVYYGGTEEQWNSIQVSTKNDPLLSAQIHFDAGS